jgi:dihydroorotase
MKLLIKSAIIIDKGNPLHRKKRDILIENGIIKKIAATIENTSNIKELRKKDLHVSIGWFDSSVSFGEPGFEERETLDNGLLTAAKSGFTAIALNPNTNPITDNRASVNYLKTNAEKYATELYPIGSLTKNAAGIDMAELYDMQQAGAIAFNDYKKSTGNPNLLKTALKYAQAFDGLVMSFPQEEAITNNSNANESPQTLELGFKGNPNLAEELQIARDLYLLEYTGGSLHIPTISTAKSVKLIKTAQKKGLNVSCSVSAHHLVLTDAELESFNTNTKVSPPLRISKDCQALKKGVKEGVITMITADHQPLDIENKKKEFAHAKAGTIGLESLFGAVNSILELDDFINAITKNPRATFGIELPQLKEGAKANLTFFNPNKKWTFTNADILSTSKNAIFLEKELKGIVYGIFNKNRLVIK